VDQAAVWPQAGIRALFEAGLGGLVVSREHGGLGHGLLATAQVCATLGRECASTALCFGMHLVASAVINAKSTEEQGRQFLAPIASGQHLTTLALSEPGTGVHFYLPQTRMADAEPDGFTVTGTKSFVTNGGRADSYVLSTVAADPDAPPGLFSCVVVPADSPGLTWGQPWAGMGMRGNSSVTLKLEDVPVARANLLGQPGDQIWYIFEVVAPYFLTAMAGTYLGVAEAALEEVRSHLLEREYDHTGASLARQQVLQHRLGQMWATVARCRSLLYHAAAAGDTRPAEGLLDILSAKAEVAESAVNVVNEAMTLTGGMAYRENSRLARLLRDARAAHIMSPTTDLLRVWTGRAYLGLPLLSDEA
jgi:alkylation response protein AidB-like acyl-CoA dehydrogenase